jgi:hypothetical protein
MKKYYNTIFYVLNKIYYYSEKTIVYLKDEKTLLSLFKIYF